MTDPICWGVLGASNFALKEMCPAMQLSHGAVFAALATRSADKAAPFAALAPGLRVHDDYDAVLGDPDIDAVYIPLPNHLHVEWSLKALEAGKHVLCEKPIALRAGDIDRLIEARDRTGLFCAEGFMVVHHPQWAHVRGLLSEGRIGKLRHIQGAFSFYNDDRANIRNREDAGGGATRDIGVYPVVTARHVLGAEPEVIRSRFDWELGIDAGVAADLLFPGDVTMNFYCSMRMSPRQEMIFHGEDGVIRVSAPFNTGKYKDSIVELTCRDGREEIVRHPNTFQYVLQLDAVRRTIRESAEYPCPLEFSRGNQQVIDALYAKGNPPT